MTETVPYGSRLVRIRYQQYFRFAFSRWRSENRQSRRNPRLLVSRYFCIRPADQRTQWEIFHSLRVNKSWTLESACRLGPGWWLWHLGSYK